MKRAACPEAGPRRASPSDCAAYGRLAAAAAAGDRRAFADLVGREESRMHALAMGRLGDEHLTMDVVQDALLSAWKSIGGLREPRAFRSWLSRIVVNVAITALRRQRAREHVALDERIDAAPPEMPDRTGELEGRRRLLAAALAELDEDKQAVLAMRYSRDMTYAEIAAQLGVTENAVRGKLFKVREKLRARLGNGRRPLAGR